MDPPVSLKCVFFSLTTYVSTSVIACVFFSLTRTRVILHVCSFHIPPMDPPVSLKCVFSIENTHGSTGVIACVFSSQPTHGSTSVIACVFFLVTTTRIIEMCVLFTYHLWIHQCHCMCV